MAPPPMPCSPPPQMTQGLLGKKLACAQIRQAISPSMDASDALIQTTYATFKTISTSVYYLVDLHHRGLLRRVDKQLMQWIMAKRQVPPDYAVADQIRLALRRLGLEPDAKDEQTSMMNATPQQMLDAWQRAKKRQDFATADRLRDELRLFGIDAEEERPDERRGPPSPESPLAHFVDRRAAPAYPSRRGCRGGSGRSPFGDDGMMPRALFDYDEEMMMACGGYAAFAPSPAPSSPPSSRLTRAPLSPHAFDVGGLLHNGHAHYQYQRHPDSPPALMRGGGGSPPRGGVMRPHAYTAATSPSRAMLSAPLSHAHAGGAHASPFLSGAGPPAMSTPMLGHSPAYAASSPTPSQYVFAAPPAAAQMPGSPPGDVMPGGVYEHYGRQSSRVPFQPEMPTQHLALPSPPTLPPTPPPPPPPALHAQAPPLASTVPVSLPLPLPPPQASPPSELPLRTEHAQQPTPSVASTHTTEPAAVAPVTRAPDPVQGAFKGAPIALTGLPLPSSSFVTPLAGTAPATPPAVAPALTSTVACVAQRALPGAALHAAAPPSTAVPPTPSPIAAGGACLTAPAAATAEPPDEIHLRVIALEVQLREARAAARASEEARASERMAAAAKAAEAAEASGASWRIEATHASAHEDQMRRAALTAKAKHATWDDDGGGDGGSGATGGGDGGVGGVAGDGGQVLEMMAPLDAELASIFEEQPPPPFRLDLDLNLDLDGGGDGGGGLPDEASSAAAPAPASPASPAKCKSPFRRDFTPIAESSSAASSHRATPSPSPTPSASASPSPHLPTARHEPHVEAILDEWQALKRSHDYERADALRVELKAKYGVDAEVCRPKPRATPVPHPKMTPPASGRASPAPSTSGSEMEASLDEEQRRIRRQAIPCTYWKAGSCHHGDKCEFLHSDSKELIERARKAVGKTLGAAPARRRAAQEQASPSTDERPKTRTAAASPHNLVGICWEWNRGAPCSAMRCSLQHICQSCRRECDKGEGLWCCTACQPKTLPPESLATTKRAMETIVVSEPRFVNFLRRDKCFALNTLQKQTETAISMYEEDAPKAVPTKRWKEAKEARYLVCVTGPSMRVQLVKKKLEERLSRMLKSYESAAPREQSGHPLMSSA